jgi:hypothetical protein
MALSTACTGPAIRGYKFLLSKNLDQHRGFSGAAQGFWSLEVNLIVDLTTKHAKGF